MEGHQLTFARVAQDGPVQFQGICECGATSRILSAAGMVHGWHAAHLDTVREDA
jgi:hypothetical protein